MYLQNTNKRWPLFALRPVQGVGLGVLALALSFSPLEQVMAQDVPALSISIPAQSLNQALLESGSRQIFKSIICPRPSVACKARRQRRMTPQQAMQSLLKGTGVQASWKGRTVSLSRSGRVDMTDWLLSRSLPRRAWRRREVAPNHHATDHIGQRTGTLTA